MRQECNYVGFALRFENDNQDSPDALQKIMYSFFNNLSSEFSKYGLRIDNLDAGIILEDELLENIPTDDFSATNWLFKGVEKESLTLSLFRSEGNLDLEKDAVIFRFNVVDCGSRDSKKPFDFVARLKGRSNQHVMTYDEYDLCVTRATDEACASYSATYSIIYMVAPDTELIGD